MTDIIQSFVQLGALGVTCAALFYMLLVTQKRQASMEERMIGIVENNTKAVTRLEGVIDKCQLSHRST
jgi:hypothetical protein